MIHLLLTLLCAVQPVQEVAPQEGARYSDQLFPGIVPVDGKGGPSVAVTCVLDALTGLPIPGARLTALFEAAHPLPGEWWSTRSAFADAEGWVRLRLDDLAPHGDSSPGAEPWLYVEAPGYAPVARFGNTLEPGVRLERGQQHEVLVHDAFDRPIADAQVSWYLGCGHTPDVRVERTDAQGWARFSDVDPENGDLWVLAPGHGVAVADPLMGGFTLVRLGPAPVVRGRVLDRLGAPLEGYFVGRSVYHRGPWVRTGSGGRFELVGLPLGYTASVFGVGQTNSLGSFVVPSEEREFVLAVGPDADELSARVEVTVRAAGGELLSGVPVEFSRVSDGHCARAHTDEFGLASLTVPMGRFSVRAGGGGSGFETRRSDVEVADGAGARVELELEPSPRIELDVAALPEGAQVVLISALEEVGIRGETGELIAVPSEGLLGLRVELEGRARVLELSAADLVEGARVELLAPEPLRVRVSLADPAGAPARGWALLVDPYGSERRDLESVRGAEPGTELELASWLLGPVDLWAVPEDGGFAPRRVRLELGLGTEPLEVGEVRFADPVSSPLMLREADGAPLSTSRVELRRVGERHPLAIDDQGNLIAGTFEPQSGDLLRIETEGLAPFRAELVGPGPWTVTRPAGSLTVEVLDEAGMPLPVFGMWIDGEFFAASGPRATLGGLAPGLHRAVLVAPGRQSLLWQWSLGLDEQRTVRLPLPVLF